MGIGLRGHKLLTKELRDRIPAMRAQEGLEDPIAYVKFFSPYSGWTWYATEFDGEDLFLDRKSTRLNSSHVSESRMPSSA